MLAKPTHNASPVSKASHNHNDVFNPFFIHKGLTDLYVYGKKFYNYKCVNPDFRCRFTKPYMVDREEYVKRKREASLKILQGGGREPMFINRSQLKRAFVYTILGNTNLTNKERIKALGCSQSIFSRYVNNFIDDHEDFREYYKDVVEDRKTESESIK